MSSTLTVQDIKAQLDAEKEQSAARKLAIRKAAKAAGINVQSKTRRLASEIVRSFGRSQVQGWLTTILPSAEDEAQIEAQRAKVEEWKVLLAGATDTTRVPFTAALDGAEHLLRIMIEKSAGGGTLEPEQMDQMRKLAVNLIKSGKVSPTAIARLVEDGLPHLQAVGFVRK